MSLIFARRRRGEAMTELCRFSFTYTIKEKDCVRALRAHARTNKILWVTWIVFGAMAAYALLAGSIGVRQGTMEPSSFARIVLIFAAAGALMWGNYWLPPIWAMRGSLSLGVEEEISLFDDRIVIESSLGRDELLWAHFRKADEIAGFFLLHPHEGNVYPVPKRYFANAAELDWFRHWIRKHIPDFHQH